MILTIPCSAHPTFLHDVQQSDLNAVFKSKKAIFRNTNPTGWDRSDIFLIPGEGVSMPKERDIRQRWNLASMLWGGLLLRVREEFGWWRETTRGGRGKCKGIPEDLEGAMKYHELLGEILWR
jgi:hypothetical protein